MTTDQLVHPVTEIAVEAGELLLSHFQSATLQTAEKSFLDVVTQADTEAEELIVQRLRHLFPDDAVVGEEGTATSSKNGRCWYVDPLDGTFNFSRGLPFWCVSIGLVDGNVPEFGLVFDPMRREMFTAVRSDGAFLNGERIFGSQVTDPLRSTLQLTLNYDRQAIEESIRDFNSMARDVMRLRNLGALALEMAYVACGRLDAVCQRGSHPWDYAAGALICQEAGVTVTDLDGSPFDLKTDDAIAAATPELHTSLLRLLSQAPRPPGRAR